MKKILVLFLMSLLMLTSVSLKAQCRYCKTYEDYVAGRWQSLDTIYFDQHSKSHQVWWGGSDFTLKTGDKALDKMLKKEVFAVMQADIRGTSFPKVTRSVRSVTRKPLSTAGSL